MCELSCVSQQFVCHPPLFLAHYLCLSDSFRLFFLGRLFHSTKCLLALFLHAPRLLSNLCLFLSKPTLLHNMIQESCSSFTNFQISFLSCIYSSRILFLLTACIGSVRWWWRKYIDVCLIFIILIYQDFVSWTFLQTTAVRTITAFLFHFHTVFLILRFAPQILYILEPCCFYSSLRALEWTGTSDWAV